MMNPNLNKNRAFREQVKVCLKNIFGPYTNTHIGITSLVNNTRVLALVILYEDWGNTYKENFQSVEFCNIYNYRQICSY